MKNIYQAMFVNPSLDSTLLVLAGDHGMNDAGNHGGSAAGETSPALVFISPKFETISSGYKTPAPQQENFEYYKKVVQSDIVPTLAALLEFPVPRNNLGVLIPDMLQLWSSGKLFRYVLVVLADQDQRMIDYNSSCETPGRSCL